MCMKPIRSVDAPFRSVSNVIQVQTVSHIRGMRVEGRMQVNRQKNDYDTHSCRWMVEFVRAVWS